MKKAIIRVCIIGSLLIILAQFGFFEAMMMFWLAGVIPGTSYSIPSNIMYGLLLACISVILIHLVRYRLVNSFFDHAPKTTPKSSLRRKHLPKRRFSQV